jgi:16S rRNA (guanine527-N7)-methyltransferase
MTAPIDTLRAGAAALGTTLSDRQAEQLLAYGTLMLKWNKVYNLTACATRRACSRTICWTA